MFKETDVVIDVMRLISLAIDFREQLTVEFGVNEYWDDKLTESLNLLGYDVKYNGEKAIVSVHSGTHSDV